jgi:glycine/D-amino acid oxidase-like deaminating enzyme
MDAPLVDAHVCQYENTASGDFIIDRHPRRADVWIVGGGSGHGFKHGPSVGKHVADLLGGRAAVEPRFALAGRSTEAARAVY